MTINFSAARNYSWMSQASYLDLSTVINGNTDDLIRWLKNSPLNADKIFASDQATSFTAPTTGFTFIDHHPNDYLVGFSATVFKSNADQSYTIAVRGTEPTLGQAYADLWNADVLGVVLQGKARDQVVEAYRYYKALITPQGQSVSYSTSEMLNLLSLKAGSHVVYSPLMLADLAALGVQLATDIGLGAIPAGSKVNFTGHSLGGHVATLLAQMVAGEGSTSVGEVVTYNAPGQGGIVGELLKYLGIPLADQTIASKIINLIGEGGMDATAEIGDRPGEIKNVFIEKEGNISMDNHSICRR